MLAGIAVACTAGDDLVYSSAPGAPGEGGAPLEDAGRVVTDSEVDVVERQNDGATLPTSTAPLPCNGLGTACDPTAGQGCCLEGPADGTGNACFEQVQVFNGPACAAAGSVFLACLASDNDSLCCWEQGKNTRYKASCTTGPEACDPLADAGAVCVSGGACNAIVCKGVTVGFCGNAAPPCQP